MATSFSIVLRGTPFTHYYYINAIKQGKASALEDLTAELFRAATVNAVNLKYLTINDVHPDTDSRPDQKAEVAVSNDTLKKRINSTTGYVMQRNPPYQNDRRVEHARTTWPRKAKECKLLAKSWSQLKHIALNQQQCHVDVVKALFFT